MSHSDEQPRKGQDVTAMSCAPYAPSIGKAELVLEAFQEFDPPEGFRAELIEGEIVMAPPPDGDHEAYINRITKQVFRHSRVEMDSSGNKGLRLKGPAYLPDDHVIPDVTFAPTESEPFWDTESWMSPEGVVMVAEVTSSKPTTDREDKRRSYARGAIPLYLLVDRSESVVILFSDPDKGDYRKRQAVPIGDPLPLPEPFGFDFNTAEFLRPGPPAPR
jgi:Uma2 family endonuclease